MSITAERDALVITREQAAEILGISVKSFERHVLPQIRTVKVGRRVIIPAAAVHAFLAGEDEVQAA